MNKKIVLEKPKMKVFTLQGHIQYGGFNDRNSWN